MRFNAVHGSIWFVALGGLLRLAHANEKAAAEILFDEGKKLLGEGKLAEACPKLAESHRLDPGVGTLLYLAECQERAGKLASAWATWREASALAMQTNQPQRVKLAKEHADKLEPRLIKVQIEVPPASDIATLSITRNGAPLARPLWGSAMPVDPGAIEVVASAPGRVPWRLTIQGSSPGTLVLRVPPLEAEPLAPAASAPAASAPATAAPVATSAAPPATTSAPSTTPPPPVPTAESKGTSRRTLALIPGGVGLLGVVAGSYFGLKTMRTWDDARGQCSGNLCNADAHRLSKDAQSSATLSTVFFAVGAVGLGAGAYLWATSPSERTAQLAPVVGPGLAGLSLQKGF